MERLHRIDDAHVGTLCLERRADRVELGLGEDVDRLGAAEPSCAKRHLRCGLLTRDEQRATARSCDRPERGEQEGRLPDAGLPADEHERSRHEPTAQNTVELRDSGRDAIRILDAHRADGDGLQGDCRDALGRRAVQLLDQAAEDTAARALPEPAARGRATFGACELDGDLRHRVSLGTRSDTTPSRKCADSLESRGPVHKSAVRPPQTSTKGRAVWTT